MLKVVIEIEQSTLERLERLVEKTVDALEHRKGSTARGEGEGTAERSIDPHGLPNLTHTTILDASLDGESIARPNWKLLLDRVLVLARKRLGNRRKLMALCPAHVVRGCKEDEGYHHLAEINVSVERLSVNKVCEALVAVAQGLGIALEVGFKWQPKEKAAHPGERARLKLQGARPADGKETA